ncbi:MAG: DinB family protein [Gammaproteobacteria bacterium]|nr:DinB family protein [Gammaproteobacteria bacterium]MBU1506522.1 DinB family protein [Gammaproteobacteria bacterium]MBU2119042.1 DinB family protein [Gammaproteobacteria bacterium]MBU2171817.1 DinB family protein [Gammaproteobacteria bacterium]MBU2201234.1 DinB family protein [Gammaproteobacteria bacterium]
MNTLSSLFAYKTWADTELLELIEQASSTKSPNELRSAIRRLNHVNVSERIFRAHLSGERHSFAATNTEETPSISELKADLLENDEWFEHYVSSSSSLQLQEVIPFTFTDGDKGAMSCEEMLLHVITHGGYHRGNVGEMLDAIGIDAPRDLYTRFLHQLQPARREA